MKRKGLILLIVILIVAILYKYLSSKFEYRPSDEVLINGKEFNNVRSSQGVPIIESDWVTHESDSTKVYWAYTNRTVYKLEPLHLYKLINFESGKPLLEEDGFHYEGRDSIAYRLTIVHKYKNTDELQRVENELIIYYRGKYPPSKYKTVTDTFADSVLTQWKLLPQGM